MSIETTLVMNLSTTEVLDATAAPGVGANKSVPHNAFDVSKKLGAATTPKASLISEFELAAASGTIDLSDVPTLQDPHADATGLRLVALRLHNTGGHAFELAIGASNGYALDGNALAAAPGGNAMQDYAATLLAIDGTHKELDWTMTGYASPDKVQVSMIFGPTS